MYPSSYVPPRFYSSNYRPYYPPPQPSNGRWSPYPYPEQRDYRQPQQPRGRPLERTPYHQRSPQQFYEPRNGAGARKYSTVEQHIAHISKMDTSLLKLRGVIDYCALGLAPQTGLDKRVILSHALAYIRYLKNGTRPAVIPPGYIGVILDGLGDVIPDEEFVKAGLKRERVGRMRSGREEVGHGVYVEASRRYIESLKGRGTRETKIVWKKEDEKDLDEARDVALARATERKMSGARDRRLESENERLLNLAKENARAAVLAGRGGALGIPQDSPLRVTEGQAATYEDRAQETFHQKVVNDLPGKPLSQDYKQQEIALRNSVEEQTLRNGGKQLDFGDPSFPHRLFEADVKQVRFKGVSDKHEFVRPDQTVSGSESLRELQSDTEMQDVSEGLTDDRKSVRAGAGLGRSQKPSSGNWSVRFGADASGESEENEPRDEDLMELEQVTKKPDLSHGVSDNHVSVQDGSKHVTLEGRSNKQEPTQPGAASTRSQRRSNNDDSGRPEQQHSITSGKNDLNKPSSEELVENALDKMDKFCDLWFSGRLSGDEDWKLFDKCLEIPN